MVPTLEVASNRVVHHLPENKHIFLDALEVKCEAIKSDQARKLLFDATNSGAIPKRKLGFFVPYRAKADLALYKATVRQHLSFLEAASACIIRGLHETILKTLVPCPRRDRMVPMEERLLSAVYETVDDKGQKERKYIIRAIERTRKSESEGKYRITFTKEAAPAAYSLIDSVLCGLGNESPEQRALAATGEPYSSGIRRGKGRYDNTAESALLLMDNLVSDRQQMLDKNFRVRDNSMIPSDVGPSEYNPDEIQAKIQSPWFDDERRQNILNQSDDSSYTQMKTAARYLNGTDGRLDQSMVSTLDSSVVGSIQSELSQCKLDVEYLRSAMEGLLTENASLKESQSIKDTKLEQEKREMEMGNKRRESQLAAEITKLEHANCTQQQEFSTSLHSIATKLHQMELDKAESDREKAATSDKLDQLLKLMASQHTSPKSSPRKRRIRVARVSMSMTNASMTSAGVTGVQKDRAGTRETKDQLFIFQVPPIEASEHEVVDNSTTGSPSGPENDEMKTSPVRVEAAPAPPTRQVEEEMTSNADGAPNTPPRNEDAIMTYTTQQQGDNEMVQSPTWDAEDETITESPKWKPEVDREQPFTPPARTGYSDNEVQGENDKRQHDTTTPRNLSSIMNAVSTAAKSFMGMETHTGPAMSSLARAVGKSTERHTSQKPDDNSRDDSISNIADESGNEYFEEEQDDQSTNGKSRHICEQDSQSTSFGGAPFDGEDEELVGITLGRGQFSFRDISTIAPSNSDSEDRTGWSDTEDDSGEMEEEEDNGSNASPNQVPGELTVSMCGTSFDEEDDDQDEDYDIEEGDAEPEYIADDEQAMEDATAVDTSDGILDEEAHQEDDDSADDDDDKDLEDDDDDYDDDDEEDDYDAEDEQAMEETAANDEDDDMGDETSGDEDEDHEEDDEDEIDDDDDEDDIDDDDSPMKTTHRVMDACYADMEYPIAEAVSLEATRTRAPNQLN